MKKTTVYLPDDLKEALSRLAASSGRSEAELIREAVGALARATPRSRPRGRLWASGDPSLAERVDAFLPGFGER